MIIKKATMSSSSQGFEFLDLSGVCDEDRQHLLSLFTGDNPAVVLLSSDVNAVESERDEDGDEVAVSSLHSQLVTSLEGSPPPEAESLFLEETIQEEYSSPLYISEGEYGVEGKVSVMSGSTSAQPPPPPPPQVPSITSSTATTSSGPVGSSNVGTADLAMREFSVPPPTVQGQAQVGMQQGGHQQVGPSVYHQPYPAPSPGNPPVYNPSMPPPSHTQPPPPSNVYSQMPPPPPVIQPPAATTVYVANCHVNVSPYSGAQVPVLASNTGPSQSPPPTPVMQSIPIMPEQNSVHMQPLKSMHDGKPEFENRRYDNFRGSHRGRGRVRGRGRRTNNERSNSVGSDHSGYGGEKHYPESMGPPQYPGPVPAQNVYYNVHYQMRGGGYQYANVPAAQVQGLPLMYSQPQYSQYMQYPAHHSAGHLLPYQQQSGTHGSQHPAAIHVHHQPPHQQPTHHPQPHPHHYQHHPEPPHMQHHPPHEHQYQVDQPQPEVEQPIFPENPEIMSSVESEANSPFVSASQTGPTQYESNSSVGVSAPVLNASPSVTAAPEADRLTPLTTQASAMTLEETSEVAFSTTDKTVIGNQQPLVTDDPQMINTVSGVGNTGSPSSTCIVPTISQPQINDTSTSPLGSQSIVSKPLVSLPIINQQSQMVLTPITKSKNEPKPIVSLNLEHTGISDITFMSDEIQPNVDPQDAVDFSSIPKPAVMAQNTTQSSCRVVPSLVSEGFVAAPDSVGTPSSNNIGNSVVVIESGAAVSPAHTQGGATLREVPKKNNVLPEMAANPQPGGAWAQKKSWSQLFKPCEEGIGAKQVAYVAPFNQDSEKLCGDTSIRDVPTLKTEPLLSEADIDKAKIGAMLRGYVQDHHQVALQPRGLINKGYWCYVNAPLQALLACPPFYNLMKNVPNIAGLKKGKSTTPVIDSIVEYVHEFSDMAPALKHSKKDKTNAGARMEPEIVTGSPFEPLYVYKMLANMGGDMFTEGRQQDAEEMLSVVLNGLHDEMVESLKVAGGDNTPTPSDNSLNGSLNGEAVTSDLEELLSEDDEDEWQVMGPRKKSCVTRTAHITPSPISAIFWGQLRSVLHQAGGVTTANLQPFTTLPLDIQSPKVESVRDALEHLVSREDIPDYTCSKTNQEVTVCKQVLLETLPTVLILQLKRFIYDKDGGLQKITKKVNFPIDLEITKELMSPNSRGKFTTLQRKYKLLAVIYHDGKEANKGHYIADIYHSGYNCWLRYDDSAVKSVSESNVLRHVTPRVPYLLFYRRGDTLVGSSVKPKA